MIVVTSSVIIIQQQPSLAEHSAILLMSAHGSRTRRLRESNVSVRLQLVVLVVLWIVAFDIHYIHGVLDHLLRLIGHRDLRRP